VRDKTDDLAVRHRLAKELLLGYLQASSPRLWPGADGVTLEEVLVAYPQAASAGLVPDLCELVGRHPDLTEELKHLVPLERWGSELRPDGE
jgi:hypothetical protein